MRSSTFIIVSLIIHIIAVAAVALAPQRTIEPTGGQVEMSVGAPDETAGAESAPEQTMTSPAPAPKVEETGVEKSGKKTVTKTVKKAAPKKSAPVVAKAPEQTEIVKNTEEIAELPAKEE